MDWIGKWEFSMLGALKMNLNGIFSVTEFPGSLLQENPQPVVSQPDPQQFVYVSNQAFSNRYSQCS